VALAGVPAEFKLAVVVVTANLIVVSDTAVIEAGRLRISPAKEGQ
jgi:hypothetical protein